MIATGWLIAGGIISLIILLLAVPVVIHVYYSNTAITFRVKYLFFTIFQYPMKPKKPKKPKKQNNKPAKEKTPEPNNSDKAAENTDSADTENIAEQKKSDTVKSDKKPKKEKKPKKKKKEKDPRIPTLSEIVELIKTLTDSLMKPLKLLLKRIRISDLDIAIICGGEDAAKAALNFGKMNLVVGDLLGILGSFFTLKNPHIDINVDFMSEETQTEISCKVSMSMLAALAFTFCFIGRLIVRVLRSDKIKGYIARLRGKTDKKAA